MSDSDSPAKHGYRRSRRRQSSHDADRVRSPSEEYRKRSETDRRRPREPAANRRDKSRSPERIYRKRSYSPERRRDGDGGEKRRRHDSDRRDSHRHRDNSEPRSAPRTHHDKPKRSRSPQPLQRSRGPLPSQKDAFTGEDSALHKDTPPVEKQKPNFGTTGRLAAEANAVKSTDGQTIVLKYHEPPEARKPSARDSWRMYVFKGADIVDTVQIAEQSCWLFGREVAVVDYPVEHPSCSKQHAVIQFRYIERRNEYGDKKGKVRPYLIDLESANGTKVNGEQIPAGRYVELRDKDVIHFGHSSREYVVQLPPAG